MKRKILTMFSVITLLVCVYYVINNNKSDIIKITKKDNFRGFNFKTINKINYGDYNLEDYLAEEVSCDEDACTFQDYLIEYEFTEHSNLGYQTIELKLNYKDKEYKNTFNVNIVDTEEPYINLSTDEVEVKLNSKFNVEDYIIEIYDNYDKDLIDVLKIDNPVNTKVKGDYIVKFYVEDSSGNYTSTKMKVKVVDEVSKIYPTKNTTTKKEISKTKIPYCSHNVLNEEETNNMDSINIKIWTKRNPRLTVKKSITNFENDISDKGYTYLFNDIVLNISTNIIDDTILTVTDPNNKKVVLSLNSNGQSKFLINKLGTYIINISYKKDDSTFNYKYELLVKDEEPLNVLSYKLYEIKDTEAIYFKYNEGVSNLEYEIYIYDTNDDQITLTDGKYKLKVLNDVASFKYKSGKYYKIKVIVTDKYSNVKTLDFKIDK